MKHRLRKGNSPNRQVMMRSDTNHRKIFQNITIHILKRKNSKLELGFLKEECEIIELCGEPQVTYNFTTGTNYKDLEPFWKCEILHIRYSCNTDRFDFNDLKICFKHKPQQMSVQLGSVHLKRYTLF